MATVVKRRGVGQPVPHVAGGQSGQSGQARQGEQGHTVRRVQRTVLGPGGVNAAGGAHAGAARRKAGGGSGNVRGLVNVNVSVAGAVHVAGGAGEVRRRRPMHRGYAAAPAGPLSHGSGGSGGSAAGHGSASASGSSRSAGSLSAGSAAGMRAARQQPPAMSPGECRVLAFGDSLTEGYHSGGHRFDPYSTHLGALVAGLAVAVPAATEPTTRAGKGRERRPARVVHLPQGNRIPVMENLGKSGEKVGPMSLRLDERLARAPLPDVVLILGGTNNLSSSSSADAIVSVLHYMHRRCWEAGCVTACVTLPQMTGEGGAVMFQRKLNGINAQLRRLALDNAERCFLVDLYVGTRQTDPANSALWDDNIHFGPEGYQLFAKLIAESWAKWTTERAAVN